MHGKDTVKSLDFFLKKIPILLLIAAFQVILLVDKVEYGYLE